MPSYLWSVFTAEEATTEGGHHGWRVSEDEPVVCVTASRAILRGLCISSWFYDLANGSILVCWQLAVWQKKAICVPTIDTIGRVLCSMFYSAPVSDKSHCTALRMYIHRSLFLVSREISDTSRKNCEIFWRVWRNLAGFSKFPTADTIPRNYTYV